MTRNEQNKILDAKIESNVNQYKVDRMNAEISAFSSGDLNKYEFLTRKDLKYKPNALDKARFQFSPLGQTFSTGLDKNAQGDQGEGVIKLLKDIRDGLRGVNRRPNDNRWDDEFDNMSDDSSFDDDGSFDKNDNGSDLNKKYNSLLLKHFQLGKNMNGTSEELKDELDKTKDELDKTKDELDKTREELDKTKDELHDSHDFNGFDEDGIHKDTGKHYDPNGFNSYGIHTRTNDKYDHNGFDIKGFHKDTKNLYDTNGFNINGNHVITNDKYDNNGFNRNGYHKDTNTIYDPNGFDKYGHNVYDNRKKPSKIKTSEAKSFEDQKGNGYVDLPILLSKLNINTVEPSALAHSSKELISNVKQLINDLYDNKQITKQVYNNLIKAITYK